MGDMDRMLGHREFVGWQSRMCARPLQMGDQLDTILEACVAAYLSALDEDQQVSFKGNAKGFVRTYGFLSSVLPYNNAGWEKRSIFLNFLV